MYQVEDRAKFHALAWDLALSSSILLSGNFIVYCIPVIPVIPEFIPDSIPNSQIPGFRYTRMKALSHEIIVHKIWISFNSATDEVLVILSYVINPYYSQPLYGTSLCPTGRPANNLVWRPAHSL